MQQTRTTRRLIQLIAATAALALAGAASAVPPDVGPQVRVDTGGQTQANETTFSSGNFNPKELVCGWNDYRSQIKSGFGLSLDGGYTWTDYLIRPPSPYQSSVEGDPMTCYDERTGYMWAGAISFTGGGGVYVARKAPGATTFEPAVMARVSGGADKCWMAAGPVPGNPDSTRVYIAYNEGMLRSDDLGQTWSSPASLGSGLGFLPRIGPNGELYVCYWDWYADTVAIKRSLNGGLSFTTHHVATRMGTWSTADCPYIAGYYRVPPLNYLAVDPNTGTLYCVYFDLTNFVGGNGNVDLYLSVSTDQGTSWSTPHVVNGDSSPPGDQFFPWIEVDQHGRLHMVFLDTRNSFQNDNDPVAWIDAYYSYSDDGGATWNEIVLTPNPYDSQQTGNGGGFLGDYMGMGLANGKAFPCYLSNQDGSSDIFMHIVTALPGDLNNDCVVDQQDLGILLGAYGNSDVGDIDGDGITGQADLGIMLGNYGESCTS
ncbi:MAG: hypothetical protein KAS72_09820 [Phycisphaerales bacterium]|nr:hypothetical protein [Phycisphaerales bacterium]